MRHGARERERRSLRIAAQSGSRRRAARHTRRRGRGQAVGGAGRGSRRPPPTRPRRRGAPRRRSSIDGDRRARPERVVEPGRDLAERRVRHPGMFLDEHTVPDERYGRARLDRPSSTTAARPSRSSPPLDGERPRQARPFRSYPAETSAYHDGNDADQVGRSATKRRRSPCSRPARASWPTRRATPAQGPGSSPSSAGSVPNGEMP